jgi:uncharacterized integral membrane protein
VQRSARAASASVILVLAPVAALAYLLWAFFAAPTDPPSARECFECTYDFGRYWEFGVLVILLAFNVVGWWIGAAVGAGARRLYRRSASTRPSAA